MSFSDIPGAPLQHMTAGERWREVRQLVDVTHRQQPHLGVDGIHVRLLAEGHDVDRDEVRAAFEAA